jgi:hypothetical protein
MVDATTWLTEANPRALREYLQDRSLLSRRKDRLIACACCRRAWPFLTDERSRRAVEAAERFADGARLSLERYYQAARAVADERGLWGARMDGYGEASAAHDAIAVVDDDDSPAYLVCRDPYVPGAADIIRDLAGNPFRLVPFDALWPTRNGAVVLTMATAIYNSRTFGDLPILADALEDVGCDNEDILGHCRAGGEHYRGCWVLDGLLGRG